MNFMGPKHTQEPSFSISAQSAQRDIGFVARPFAAPDLGVGCARPVFSLSKKYQ
jgi:hypothetical protein